MSKLNRRIAMKRAAAAGMAASASTMVAGTVRAEGNQESAQPGAATQEKQSAILANNHVPMSIFVRGKQQLQLTGGKSAPGAPMWCAKADDSSICQVTVQPVEIGTFPVEYWELTITGLKMGSTQVHVQETVAPPVRVPVRTLYDFVLDVTVLGLLA
jgi:hypothetical protein